MVSHISFLSLMRWAMISVSLLLFFSIQLYSQPTLSFNRIGVNWPTISLWISTKCGNDLRLDITTENFKIKENGIGITDFTITCPDPNWHCCISVALVIDIGDSMQGEGLNGAKAGAKAFVDAMDGICDEATLVSANQAVKVDVFMTNDKLFLTNGIDGLKAGGQTAIWDAVVTGIQELVNNGTNECRGVILFTNGKDNASSNSIDDVISTALTNKIRVYTIGLGPGVSDADLYRIGSDTGGKYYKVPQPSQLVAVYKEISTIIGGGFYECEIQYTAKCMDGAPRDVELTLQKLFGCPGNDVKTKSYTAPKDTSTFVPITIKLGQETVTGGQIVNIPLLLDTPMNGELFNPATFNVLFDDQCCQFLGLNSKGYLLDGVQIDTTVISGGIQFRSTKAKAIYDAGILAMLRFKSTDPSHDKECALKLSAWTFDAGCFRPALADGKIVFTSFLTLIAPNGGEILCKNSATTITWNPIGFPTVDIALSSDGGGTFNEIAKNISGNVYTWQIPDSIKTGSSLIRISEHSGNQFVISKGPFDIQSSPMIVQHPHSETVQENDSVTFYVKAVGVNLTFQWMWDGDPIQGAKDSSFTILSVKKSDEGNYRVIISNYCGTNFSNSAQLYVRTETSVTDLVSPELVTLDNNYPNPFSNETAIGYRVAAATNVRLELYDLLGRKLATLIDEEQNAGSYNYTFNPEALNLKMRNGVYMCVMHAGKYTLMRQIILMR